MTRRRISGDTGSTLILTVFYGMLALVLILVLTAATSLYLERKRLFSLADAAALAGAEAFDLGAVTIEEGKLRPRLDSLRVRQAVDGFLAVAPHPQFEGLRVTQAESLDGYSATVTLRSAWRPPVLTLVLPVGLPLEVTAEARAIFR
ncbi:pilus assembly protein TadG-related protein [Glaciibacter psychrotolerans]|uniref:Putative Flp pilus-assembly TadG-like N-terminal domain-containing protein n=1 Tax=Glaciibacter psychrotolerans TaxID=670054 RepID=A0A7Z0EDP9_9MICO|nr:hypothetical protein [Leifsonia psychrotolerans]